jgi:DNA-binding transcriptional MerR regulator
MHSISGLAVHSKLPRRTLQYWADNGVLEETWGKGAKRATYSDHELELVMMLRQFAKSETPIGLMQYLAALFREVVLREDLQSSDEAKRFQPIVTEARENKPAYLIVQIPYLAEVGTGFEATLFVARNSHDLGQLTIKCMEERPTWQVVPIDLREALKQPRTAPSRIEARE